MKNLLSLFKKSTKATESKKELDWSEDDWKPTPPSEEDVVSRALALAAHLWRTQLEMQKQREMETNEDLKTRCVELREWMDREGITDKLSNEEKALFLRPFGTWSESEAFQNVWRFEALAALLWSLRQFNSMPSYLELVDGTTIMQKAHLLGSTDEFRTKCKLRSPDEISEQQEAAEFWHWRCRTEILKKQEVVPPPGATYADTIASAVEYAVSKGIVSDTVNNDVSVNGTAYGMLPHEEWAPLASLSVERHFALNWLAGFAPDNNWDETPSDT